MDNLIKLKLFNVDIEVTKDDLVNFNIELVDITEGLYIINSKLERFSLLPTFTETLDTSNGPLTISYSNKFLEVNYMGLDNIIEIDNLGYLIKLLSGYTIDIKILTNDSSLKYEYGKRYIVEDKRNNYKRIVTLFQKHGYDLKFHKPPHELNNLNEVSLCVNFNGCRYNLVTDYIFEYGGYDGLKESMRNYVPEIYNLVLSLFDNLEFKTL